MKKLVLALGYLIKNIIRPGKELRIVFLLFLSLSFFSWSIYTKAATKINDDLETQVVEIIRRNPQVVYDTLVSYQQQRREEQRQARAAFLDEFNANPAATIGNSPTQGAENLSIVLLEFGDFQCPVCAAADKIVKEFMARRGAEVTFVYKNRPLDSIHPEATPAAKAAWAAQQQGKFWEYHDALYAQQDRLSEELYLEIAQNLNLDLEKFNRDRTAAAEVIQADVALAEKLGINSTPFFIMNREVFSGSVRNADLETMFNRAKSQLEPAVSN